MEKKYLLRGAAMKKLCQAMKIMQVCKLIGNYFNDHTIFPADLR